MLKALVEKYKEALEAPNKILDEIKKHLSDASIPVDERWDSFKCVASSLPIKSYYVNIPNMDGSEINYYDNLYCDRYQTIRFTTIVEMLEERYSEEAILKLKNHLLSTGYSGCINDW